MKMKLLRRIPRQSLILLSFGFLAASVMLFSCSHSKKDISNSRASVEPTQKTQEPETVKTLETMTVEGKPLKGIDVSHFSLDVDWHEVKRQGYHFAFAKATEGVDSPDPMFDEHWRGMKQAGLIRGAYHFYVTEDEPKAQAQFFIETVTLEPGDFVPVVDIELIGKGTTPGLIKRLKTFLSIIETHYGRTPIIYTGLHFWDKHMNSHFGHYPLWVAEYGVSDPVLPKGWKNWHFWQWKENALVKGVEKNADLNIFNHKEKDFESLLLK